MASSFSVKDLPRCLNWTLDSGPTVVSGFSPPLSPQSFFPPGQRFPTLARGHVMSASQNILSFLDLNPRSFFPPGPRFSLSNHVTSGPLSLRSFFPTGQRFPTPNHMTSGSPEPAIHFPDWSAVSHPKSRDFRLP